MWGLFAWISVWMNNPTLFMFYLFIYLFILLFAKYCTYKMVTHQLFQFQFVTK